MKKIIKLENGNSLTLTSSASIPLLYMSTFNKDMFKDIQVMMPDDNKKMEISDFTIEMYTTAYQLLYIYVKKSDSSIEPFDEWIDNISEVSVSEALEIVMPFLAESLGGKESLKQSSAKKIKVKK